MIDIIRYNSEFKKQWDNLISDSRNGTFLFFRDYMDYHSDRFIDCSFLFLKKNKVVGVIPGNHDGGTFFTHQGLTYGGLISSSAVGTKDIIEIFQLLDKALGKLGIHEVIYKPVPLFYHRIPSQEDLYVLFLKKAERIGCNLSSAIFRDNRPGFTESRASGLRKGRAAGIEIHETSDFTEFWGILENNLLKKYDVRPVHKLSEIRLLRDRFPENIKLYTARKEGLTIAGSVLYVMENIAHVQYISANEQGKETGALDLLFDTLLNKIFRDVPVFDFGQSTEEMGNYLNESLIFQKEGFGGRGAVYEVYKFKIV